MEKKSPVKKEIKIAPGSIEWYVHLWKTLEFDPGCLPSITAACNLLMKHKSRYLNVEARTGVPWYVVAGIHFMEASCNFSSVLHNGEKIIGTGKKTKLVPAGRGPFHTWEDAAVDALQYDKLTEVKEWTIGVILKRCEAYNGLGYLKYHSNELTPYLWAQTNHNDGFGKYTSDGKWSDTQATNARPGIAAILKNLILIGNISIG